MGYSYIAVSTCQQIQRTDASVRNRRHRWKGAAIEDGREKIVRLRTEAFQARSLIITTGKSWRRLGVPGETELTGRGGRRHMRRSSVCRQARRGCGAATRDRIGHRPGEIAEHVTVVLSRNLPPTRYWLTLQRVHQHNGVVRARVVEIVGEQQVEKVRIRNRANGEISALQAQEFYRDRPRPEHHTGEGPAPTERIR